MLAAFQFQYPQALPWVILLVAVVSLLILLSYRAQLQQLPPRARWLPPVLRILAATALCISILRPVVTRDRIASERAPLLILIDNSHSMSIVDATRSPGEWVGIAAALGRLPTDARDRQITALQSDCDRLTTQAYQVGRARAELDYAQLAGKGLDNAKVQLNQAISVFQSIARDTSGAARAVKRMPQLEKTLAYLERIPTRVDRQEWLDNITAKSRGVAIDAETARLNSDTHLFQTDARIRDACLPLQSLSRVQISDAAVFDSVNGLLARLGVDAPFHAYAVADQVTPLPANDRQGCQAILQGQGTSTNLSGSIRAILESLKAAPPRAVVLLSDGRQVSADYDPATTAAIQGVPVFAISLPPRDGLKDLSITNVTVASTAAVGETLNFKVDLRALGLNGASSELTFGDGSARETRRVMFSEERISQTFAAVLKQPGTQRFTFDLDGVLGEASFENNHTERWVSIVPAGKKPAGTIKPATRPLLEAEIADLAGDEGWLRHLAETSGGQIFRLDQLDLLPRRLGELRDDISRPIEVPLWDGSYLFVLVLGCLATEWGIRSRYGLA